MSLFGTLYDEPDLTLDDDDGAPPAPSPGDAPVQNGDGTGGGDTGSSQPGDQAILAMAPIMPAGWAEKLMANTSLPARGADAGAVDANDGSNGGADGSAEESESGETQTSANSYEIPGHEPTYLDPRAGPGDPDAVTAVDLPTAQGPEFETYTRTYLTPDFADKVSALQQKAKTLGVDLMFRSAYRTKEDQDALQNDPAATTPARYSQHSLGRAVDISEDSWTKLGPDGQKELVAYAKQLGLRWGGDFKKQNDHRHFDAGLAIEANPANIQRFTQDIKAYRDKNPGQ